MRATSANDYADASGRDELDRFIDLCHVQPRIDVRGLDYAAAAANVA
jgi:hypothetical protein